MRGCCLERDGLRYANTATLVSSLALPELTVQPVTLEQRVVCALFNEAPVVEHVNDVAVNNGRQTMRH